MSGFIQLSGNTGGGGGAGADAGGNNQNARGAGAGASALPRPQGLQQFPPPPAPPRPPPPHVTKPQRKPLRKATGILDITQTRPKDSETVYQELITYELLTLRKADPISEKNSSWERIIFVSESLPQKDIIRQINHLNKKDRGNKQTVAYKIAKLYPHQAEQVANLLDSHKLEETDDQFEWTVCQIHKELKPSKGSRGSKKETKTIALFLQRAPRKELDPMVVWQNINTARNRELKYKREREEDAEKERAFQRNLEVQRLEMQRRQQQEDLDRMKSPQGPPIMLPIGGGNRGNEPSGNQEQGGKDGKGRKSEKGGGKSLSPKGRKKYDSESDHRSESDSASDYSWSTGTGSQSSGSRYRRTSNHNRHRSHHRYEHQHSFDSPLPREGQRVLAYNPRAESYIPTIPLVSRPMLHQRPVDSMYLAGVRQADEYRRDAEEYVRAKHRAIDEAKYRERRRFASDGYR